MFDLAIRGGTILDGRGGEPFSTDIGITGDRVSQIGNLAEGVREEIDATGLYVSPGFIDIHSHSDYTLLVDPRAVSAVHQGVTLEVVGNCGHGCFPISNPDLAKTAIYGHSESVPLTWNSADEYFTRLEESQPALNVISLVPHGQLRLATVGLTDRGVTDAELETMSKLLEDALEEGAWGLSTGLEYASEAAATEIEISRLCRSLAKRGDLYACHTRYRDSGAPRGVEEAIRTAQFAGARLQVSHLVPRSGDREMEQCLALIDKAHFGGIDVGFDMHTRLFGFTYLYSVLPPWAQTGGEAQLVELLQDSGARARMKEFRSILSAGKDWSRIVLLDNPTFPQYARRTLLSIAEERRQEPLDCIYDLLLEAVDSMASLMAMINCHTTGQQEIAFRHPLSMPASDATTMAPDGPLAGVTFPGAYTWASYFYDLTVKKAGVLSPTEAVHRLCGAPAERIGLEDRGVLKSGAFADIAVFDHGAFSERGTAFEPNQLAVGMSHVIVNGTPVLRDGELTGHRPGRVLRRGA
jgi:N-acyl-D-aspartate/D-glutamate deacylase